MDEDEAIQVLKRGDVATLAVSAENRQFEPC